MLTLRGQLRAPALLLVAALFAIPFLSASRHFLIGLNHLAGISLEWSAEELLYQNGAPTFLGDAIAESTLTPSGQHNFRTHQSPNFNDSPVAVTTTPATPRFPGIPVVPPAPGMFDDLIPPALQEKDALRYRTWTYILEAQHEPRSAASKLPRIIQVPKGFSLDEVSGLTVRLKRDTGLIDSITCSSGEPGRPQCGPLLGLWTGDSEVQALRLLGKPTSSALASGQKQLDYDDLGISIKLRLGKIQELTLKADPPQLAGALRRLLTLWPVWVISDSRSRFSLQSNS